MNDSSAHIVLIDCSRNEFLLGQDFQGVEIYRIKKWIPRIVINGPFKGLGEAIMLIASFELTSDFEFVSKLSGRYQLSSHPISTPEVLFSLSDEKASSIYYRMPIEVYREWLKFIDSNLSHLSTGVSMEDLLTKFTKKWNLNPIGKLGVEGLNGITGGLTKI
jgi:hypothetical protein